MTSTDAPPRRLTADQRRSQLFDVALQLFAERGYRATTMDDIAEAAGVTKPLLYQHFSSKRALYLLLAESVAQEMLESITQASAAAEGPRQQVEMGFAAYFRLVATREPAFRLLYGRDNGDDEELGLALRRVEDGVAEAIDPLIDAGLDDDHRRLLAYAVVGMTEGVSRHWLAQRAAAAAAGDDDRVDDVEADALRLATRMANLAWAGLRSVHSD
jgi:AcrR family transcriptional regulator